MTLNLNKFIEIVFIIHEFNLTLCNLYTILSYCLTKEDFNATTLENCGCNKIFLTWKYEKTLYEFSKVVYII